MPKFVVRGADKPEEIVEFWLETSEAGTVFLCAGSGGVGRTILASIKSNGVLHRVYWAFVLPGLQYDDKGRIKEVE